MSFFLWKFKIFYLNFKVNSEFLNRRNYQERFKFEFYFLMKDTASVRQIILENTAKSIFPPKQNLKMKNAAAMEFIM